MNIEVLNTFSDAEAFLYSSLPMFQRHGPAAYKADIGNISRLMETVGNPHSCGIRMIHIAGTNGKGSVTHLTAAYLQACGYRVGVYTSPHYTDIRERIKINGTLIGEDDFVKCLQAFLPFIEEIKPSFFEIICAMAFLYFRDQQVDFAVIETGLGGRLDSTNIIFPILSVITNISPDHQSMLGDTLEKIAYEKAGIIKKNTPVVIGQKISETIQVFQDKAASEDASISFAEDNWQCIYKYNDSHYTHLQIRDRISNTSATHKTALMGIYQTQNIITFLEICRQLSLYNNIPFNWEYISIALKDIVKLTYYIGRWQIVSQKPLIILESAHNVAGIEAVRKQLSGLEVGQVTIVFGTVSDKDVVPVLKLLPKKARYIWTKADIPRAMDEVELSEKAAFIGLAGMTSPTVKDALQLALDHTSEDDLILVTGSIFVVGDAMTGLKEKGIL